MTDRELSFFIMGIEIALLLWIGIGIWLSL